MSFDRDRLLEVFPHVYPHDPWPVATLDFAYLGDGKLQIDIAEDVLTVTGLEGAPSITVPLDTGLTFAALVATLNAVPNYAVTLFDPAAAAVDAITLVEEQGRLVTGTNTPEFTDEFALGDFQVEGGVRLGRFTNPLWRLLEPPRRALKRQARTLDVALAQLDLLTAAGFFADYWGRHTVTLRRPGELDDAYTQRQRTELLRPRENNMALAALLEADTGTAVLEVADLYPLVFRANRSRLNHDRLMGFYYNAASCEVRLGTFPRRAVVTAARQNVAAGITVFVLGTEALDAGTETTIHFEDTRVSIVPPPAMQIGVTPIGVGKIGP